MQCCAFVLFTLFTIGRLFALKSLYLYVCYIRKMPNRCEFGCVPREKPMHRFPCFKMFPDRFKTWVTLVGGKLESESDWEYYQKKFVCDKHFVIKDRTRSKRLNALAVPTLYLPGVFESQLSLQEASTSASFLPIISQPVNIGVFESQLSLQEASTSLSFLPITSQPVNTGEVISQAFTSTHYSVTANTGCVYTETFTKADVGRRVVLEHNYSAISRPKTSLHKDAHSRKVVFRTVQPLLTKMKYLRSEISRLRKRGQSFRTRLACAEKMSENIAFQTVLQKLNKPARLFLQMQRQGSKAPKGRRFTTDEKILALSLFKKSPKSYALLRKYFTLPSAKAMKRLLSEIKLTEGINPIIFNKMKKTVRHSDVTNRLCTLIFDEMSLTPQIFYNSAKDAFEGFASNQNAFADHVLVFMIKGVKHNFKQPVAYYFTSGLKKLELKNFIKLVITKVQDTGLIIVSTVCDQSATNVGAITELVDDTKASFLRSGKEWRHDVIRVNGQNIIPIFDVPHLIKGIRNNLITKEMIYSVKNVEKVVKWEHYQKLYAADKSHGELRLLNKLTEEHVNPEKINKMRVKTATQIFSHTVAVATEHLTARGDLPEECRALIEITLLLDKLFDSLNVNSFNIPNGKIYKGPVKRNSPHHQLWKDAKLILKSIKFRTIKSSNNKVQTIETTVPSVKNFIKTIDGMETIFKVLTQKYGLDALLTRNFNQDPVENFFGNIRCYGARNNAPNSVAFEGAFKALLLNNYSTPQSSKANCEEDANKCLQTLEFFLTEKPIASDVPIEDNTNFIFNENVLAPVENSNEDAGQKNYVCGWVLTKCLKNVIKSCKTCRMNLIDTENKNNAFIRAKEYCDKKWLCYPSKELETCFHDLQMILINTLKKDVPKNNIKKNTIAIADMLVSYPFKCDKHKDNVKKYFINLSLNVILHSWCRSINWILAGKITYDGEDETKTAAQSYYNRHKHNKNKK